MPKFDRKRTVNALRQQAMVDNAPVGAVGAPGGLLGMAAAKPRPNYLRGLLSGASFLPGVGDAMGLAGDALMYAQNPETRTKLNYLLTALGALPGVPSLGVIANMPRPKWAKAGEDVSVGIDPTNAEILELFDETAEFADKNWHGVLRAMKGPDGKTYAWPVGSAQHDDVAAYFGLSRDPRDHGGLIFSEDAAPNWRPRKR